MAVRKIAAELIMMVRRNECFWRATVNCIAESSFRSLSGGFGDGSGWMASRFPAGGTRRATTALKVGN